MKNTENTENTEIENKIEPRDFKVVECGDSIELVLKKGIFNVTITSIAKLELMTVSISINHDDVDHSIDLASHKDINNISLYRESINVVSKNLKTLKRSINFINKIILPEYL